MMPAISLSLVAVSLLLSAPASAQQTTTSTQLASTVTTATETTQTETEVEQPGFGQPQWFVDAVRADDWRDTSTTTGPRTYPYAQSGENRSPASLMPPAVQPSGALSGKIMFLMAGHGWTYSDEYMNWYTQRGATHGIVEDFGNLDQMHIFGHYVWNAGATVVPLRPMDHQPIERIVDNTTSHSQFYGPWLVSNSEKFFGRPLDTEPYRFAVAARQETAVARYRPFIPEAGEYPVYCWARDGADRVNQLYRIVHAGGVMEVRVNHRRVGKGWVWLGSFYFDRGTSGYVEISNQVLDPYEADGQHVVIADAIRFGNGKGDAQREGGISGELREDEGDAYWIENSLGHTAPAQLYTVGRTDGSATISAPPRTTAYMNRESDGRYYDRVLISFHSNALRGESRGAVSLFNRSASQRPDYQELLAQLTGQQVNYELSTAPSIDTAKWAARTRHTYDGINFGELRKDYLQNELCATIVEVAFHDNVDDAKFLLDPRSRIDMARAVLRGTLKWFAAIGAPNQPVYIPPTSPQQMVARALTTSTIQLSWKPGPSDEIAGEPALEYRVYLSRDGRAYDGGRAVGRATTVLLENVSTGTPTFVRVTGTNAGGESWPSEVMAGVPLSETTTTRGTVKARRETLLVAGMTSLDRTMNVVQAPAAGLGGARGGGATIYRVRPRTVLNAFRMSRNADALHGCGRHFDTCSALAVAAGDVKLADYELVVWAVGRQDAREGILTSQTQRLISDYLTRGGRLILSGAHIAEALDGPAPLMMASRQDQQFFNRVIKAEYLTSNLDNRLVLPAPGEVAFPPSLRLATASPFALDALSCDVVTPAAGAHPLLYFSLWPDGAAAVASQQVVYLAFPFEGIEGEAERVTTMRGFLLELGL
jgi:hypothetical protein